MISLTTDACIRLRNAADSEILAARPLVRVLVIDDRAPNRGGGRQVFVTDGASYAHIALEQLLVEKLGGDLHIGSVLRLLEAHRLPADDPCPVMVKCAQVTYVGMPGVETDGTTGPELDDPLIRVTGDDQELIQVSNERDEERRRRCLLEYTMKSVCYDLAPGQEGGIVPRLTGTLRDVLG